MARSLRTARFVLSAACVAAMLRPGVARAADFAREIRPVLEKRCVRCHGKAKRQSDLRLDLAAAIRAGGNRGPSIEPGKPEASLLVDVLRGRGEAPPMPPEGPRLAEVEIAAIEGWIAAGAPAPAGESELGLEEAAPAATHWAFQPVARRDAPDVKDAGWPRGGIDAFILSRLEREGLAPSGEADRPALARRLALDLTGLLPSPEEVGDFEADPSPDALDRLADRLLASPHHGERWARHWLDLARYADSNGYTIDGSRSIWKYRDWVIRAVQADMPFDELVIEQLAGDLLPDATLDQRIATGFHRNTLRNEEGGTDAEQFRVEAVADRVATTASALLGLTVGCARCHDHKYDPISQREYYRLFAFLNNCDEPVLEVPTEQQSRELPILETEIATTQKILADNEPAVARRQAEWEAHLAPLLGTDDEQVRKVPAPIRAILVKPAAERSEKELGKVAEHYRSIDKDRIPIIERLDDLTRRKEKLRKAITTTLVVAERVERRETHVHLRGDFLRSGARVEPGVPAVLPPVAPRGATPDRLDFARWLVSAQNPLTPRVTVNRLWQILFGRGLVETENDFGTQGDPPTHPELLDWLAGELVRRGFSLKAMQRAMVASATYRQSSHGREDLARLDPRNKLLGRQSRLRLEAEAIRDAALCACGLLTREIGGPGVYPPQPESVFRFTQTAKYWKESQGADRYRRGMYTYFWRSSPYPQLVTFDAPDATTTCTRRVRSNTPLQALTLANDAAFYEMARALGARLIADAGLTDEERVRRAFRLTLGREPAAVERRRLLELVAAEREEVGGDEREAWTAAARVLLNLDEVITRE